VSKKKPKRSAAEESAKAARLADPDYGEFLARLERIAAKHDAGTDVGSFSDVTSLSTPARNRGIARGDRGDALTRRLREIVRVSPEISLSELLARLHNEANESRGLISKVNDADRLVTWKDSPGDKQGKISKTTFAEIRDRLRRAKQKHKKPR
jgi:hypothetical protein